MKGVVKRVTEERHRLDRVDAAMAELLRDMRAAKVPARILALAETLQRRLDGADDER